MADTEKSSQKRKSTSQSTQFYRVDEESGKRFCTPCENDSGCKKPQSYSLKTSTTVLRDHLIQKHGMIGLRPKDTNQDKPVPVASTSDSQVGYLTVERKDKIDNLLVKFVVGRKEAFAIVEDSRFTAFVQSLNPNYTVCCRNTLENKISTSYQVYLQRFLQLVQNIPGKVGITCDGWSNRQRCDYFVITMHWLDVEWKFRSATLEFIHFPPPHNTVSTLNVILNALKFYKIEKKVMAITSDNASEMVAAIRELRKLLNLEYNADIEYDFHLRCICHVLNLGVQDALKLLKEVTAKLRQLLKVIRSSPASIAKFKNLQISLENETIYEVPSLDVETRWNSTYSMVIKCYRLKAVFDSMCDTASVGDMLKIMKLSATEWEAMYSIASFLEIAFNATEAASGCDYLTLSLQPIIFNILLNHCLKAETGKLKAVSTVPEIVEAAGKLKVKLQKYEKKLCGFLPCVALALDPRIGSTFQTTASIKEQLRDILIKKYGLNETVTSQNSERSKVAHLFQTARDLAGIAGSSGQLDELDEFYKFTKDPEDLDINPITWWSTIGKLRFPTIAKLARDVFSCTASSVPSESAFSQSSGYVTPTRSKMTDENLEIQMKLRSWFSLFDDIDNKN
jgi:hypothetical protein